MRDWEFPYSTIGRLSLFHTSFRTSASLFETLLKQRRDVTRCGFSEKQSCLHPANGANDPHKHLNDVWVQEIMSLVCLHLCAWQPLTSLLQLTCWCLLLLNFIETPSCCRLERGGGQRTFQFQDIDDVCETLFSMKGPPDDNSTIAVVEYYPNSHSFDTGYYFTITSIVDWIDVRVCVYFADCFCASEEMAWVCSAILLKGSSRLSHIVRLVSLILLMIGLGTDTNLHYPYPRLAMVMLLKGLSIHTEIRTVLKLLPGAIICVIIHLAVHMPG